MPTLSKVFERIMFDQIFYNFTKNNLLFTSQYGFRSNHSTELAALHLVDKISNYMDSGEVPMAIFLDLSKAFDTLDHDILLSKLHHYGIQNSSLNLFKSYLSNRSQYVEEQNTKSKMNPILTGVPQGSILGPLLFTIYVNDFHLASKRFEFIMYADDTTLLYKNINSNRSEDFINIELTKISRWLNLNKLSLNTSKSKFMLFKKPLKKLIHVKSKSKILKLIMLTHLIF